ncbi:RNA polymerase sigma factor [Flavivirga eckloniae]|uniref:RNA polymerase sigma factor n=1 Tax=Flavivirga eckloniae TaxID=1803846 RepID=A0A2K9PW17_9FLAO|nr:RNA polymerase sigma-70 factor [Flavivirga eckloniae]AUP81253.1 RNA polymerase sigma-70 factor [Flavivirga eckloniae]
MDDLLLIESIQNNDKQAFSVLFEKYYNALVAYITTFSSDRELSEDIIQQTFIIIWTKRHKLNINRSPKSYLYSVAYNTYIDHCRKMKSRNSFFDDLREIALRDSIVEDSELLEKRLNKLKDIIESLPRGCKEILKLNKFNGLEYKDVAIKLGISRKTVETQMTIAFKKIRKGFENDNMFLFFIRSLNNISKPKK